ncbi:hypothetical protein DO97_03940 [Neosynechococcus sphagnicola sy1]|uniref:Anthranilate synthase component 1 n=2 Tax=Neosynechococcus TaxID=1501143 RepID=A0A098TLX7_9CYAN|nr:anthranilate synthase component I [Neosynechococcus sphagnicola]KGF72872.1 hypothetical protein DO97_03940 [Neosynechococcus sphagnicola sy1]
MQPWYWRSRPLALRTGADIFTALCRPQPLTAPHRLPFATLLESPYPPSPDCPQNSRYSICGGPPRQHQGQPLVWIPPIGSILPCLRQRLHHAALAAAVTPNPDLPFTGGWLGWLGYDLAWEIEQLPYLKADELPFPVACWYEPDYFAVLDHQEQMLWLAASDPRHLDPLESRLESAVLSPITAPDPLPLITPPDFQTMQADYQAAVLQAQRYIQAGEIYQANLSVRFRVQTATDSWQLYRTLQQINPSPFANYWQTPWGVILSCSPERLVTLQGDRAQSRPIAGTRPRGNTPDQDHQLAAELLSNPKERAEHIMLVDLERNDLGRVCQWGSVQVDELLTLERYSHVMHLVSNVSGQLQPQGDAIDLIRALFPGGTITGCPKVRCLEIIEALEPQRRSLFYGSCGYLDWRGHLDLNILIRTLLLTDQPASQQLPTPHWMVWGQVGAGIVADSDPLREWEESLQKAQAQLAALGWVSAATS